MIDQRLLRENPNLITEGLKSRGMNVDLEPLQKFCKDLKDLEGYQNHPGLVRSEVMCVHVFMCAQCALAASRLYLLW